MVASSSNADSKGVDTTGWPSTLEVSDHLGVSPNTVLTWKRRKRIKAPVKARRAHPTGGFRDVDVYDPRDVERIAAERKQTSARDPGECAARVFEMLDAGAAPRTIVTALRLTPHEVEELRERWSDMGGSDIVIGPVAQAELEKHVGSFDGVAGLVAAVAKIASANGLYIEPIAQAEIEKHIGPFDGVAGLVSRVAAIASAKGLRIEQRRDLPGADAG